MSQTRARASALLPALIFAALFSSVGGRVEAQTINGTLMEVETSRPISLGLIILMTEGGDSITSGVTNSEGRFSVDAPEAGSFVLISSAFGFKETAAGVFELGEGGSMDVEFRVAAAPMPIDGILISLQRPALDHNLVTNGFVRRVTRGLGHFITPATIEKSSARSASDLLRGVPGVSLSTPGGGLNAFAGETIRMTGVGQFCTPTIYLDGVRMAVDQTSDLPLEVIAPLMSIDAVEVYRRPAEVPIEYGMTQSGDGSGGPCGVIVIWTKRR